MGKGASNGDIVPLGGNFQIGEPLGDGGHAPMLVEAVQTGGLADMSRLHAIQIGFPGGAADGYETPGANGVDGSVFVHTMRKLEVHNVVRGHCLVTSGAMVTEYCRNYLYVTRENPENNDTKNVLPVDYSFSGLLGLLCRNGKGPLPTRLEAEADRGEQGDWVVCCAGGGEIGKDRSDSGGELEPMP